MVIIAYRGVQREGGTWEKNSLFWVYSFTKIPRVRGGGKSQKNDLKKMIFLPMFVASINKYVDLV